MNYRHAFHAGNFADCVKHALLHRALDALGRKPAPFRVLDPTPASAATTSPKPRRAHRGMAAWHRPAC